MKFIALHPFVALQGYDPVEVGYGPYTVDASGRKYGQVPNDKATRYMAGVDESGKSATKLMLIIERAMKGESIRVPWSRIAVETQLDVANIQRALSLIESVDFDARDHDLRNLHVLERYCARHLLFFPSSGHIQPCMERSIGGLLEEMGQKEIIISDGLRLNSLRVSSASLLSSEPVGHFASDASGGRLAGTASVSCILTTYRDIAFETIEGAFFTSVTLPNEVANPFKRNLQTEFEGFWCEDELSWTWWK